VNAAGPQRHAFEVSPDLGNVSSLCRRPPDAHALLVFAHGAGADMHHNSMDQLTDALSEHGVASFRYQFPYAERARSLQRRHAPDRSPQLMKTVRAAVNEASQHAGDLPLFAGGKSMGGRMTSLAQAEKPLPGVRGLVFFGFPLHPAGRPGTQRADHLKDVAIPLLFLQGSRDRLAPLEQIRAVCRELGKTTSLHVVEDADHSFQVLKRTGRSDTEVLDELAGQVARFTKQSS
jgi:predicted alpha/beta-hydrolase family hydrolase